MKVTRWGEVTKRANCCWAACAASLIVSNSHAQAEPAVALHLDGSWPEQLAVEVRKDLGASLNERGVVVLADGDPAARATLRISPPTDGTPEVQLDVINPDRGVAATRELSLAREHPDTWSVAIAATADELLAATWSLPDIDKPQVTSPPPTLAQPPAPLPPKTRRGELGLGVGGEQYLPNAQIYGADLFGALALSEHLQIEVGAWFRDIVPRDSASGEIYGTVVGGDVVLSGRVAQGRWLGLDLLTGVHGGAVWFDARAEQDAVVNSVSGALLSVRAGGRISLFTSERTRLGLTVTTGVPVVRAVSLDTNRDATQLRGVELGARVEVGWQF